MVDRPAGYIGQSSELFVLKSGVAYAETLDIFSDLRVTAERAAQVQYNRAGRGEALLLGGWKGYTNQPTNWSKIGRLRDISGPETTAEEVDVTSNDSPDRTKEYIPGMKDAGNLSADMVYDVRDPSQTGDDPDSLETIYNRQQVRRFALRVPVYQAGDTIEDIAGTSRLLVPPSGGDLVTTAVDGAKVAGDATVTVDDSSKIAVGDYIQIGTEIMLVTAKGNNNALTITRAQFGTTAAAIADNAVVTARVLDNAYSEHRFSNQAFHLFRAFVTNLGNEIPMTDAIMRSVELRITGNVKSPKRATATSA